MKTTTIYQPWASLIAIEAKPFEFRKASYLDRISYRGGPSIGERIAIHASARPIKMEEVVDILKRIDDGESALDVDKAMPLLMSIYHAHRIRRRTIVPFSAVVCTAIIGEPKTVTELFADKIADSSRLNHAMWGWPLSHIEPLMPPVAATGHQGFWQWNDSAYQAVGSAR